MAPDRHPYGLGIPDMMTFATDNYGHYVDSALAALSQANLLMAQEDLVSRYARLPRAAELQLDMVSVAQRLQERYDLETKSSALLDLAGRHGTDVASDALWSASRVSVYERAIDNLVSAIREEQQLDRLGLVDYTWGLIESYIGGGRDARRLAQNIAGPADPAAALQGLYDRASSYAEYSAEFLREVQEEVFSYDQIDLDIDEETEDLDAASAKSKALESTVAKLSCLPKEPSHPLSSERIALISVCLALVFGLADQLKWYLDVLEKRREAAESVLEQEVIAERHREAMESAARLNRTMEVLVAQALSQGISVVRRPVAVRSRPGGGLVLGAVYPNQQVEITGKHSRWLKVHFRDHIEGREIEGWVLKQYLSPMNKAAELGAAAEPERNSR